MSSRSSIRQWDQSVDVLVLGFGLAGAVTAITAHDTDPNGEILIVDRMPERYVGGNSRASGQTLFFPADVEKWMIYQQALNEPNPIPDEVLRAWAEERRGQEAWVVGMCEEVGMQFVRHARRGAELKPPVPEFPEMPGSDCVEYLCTIKPDPGGVFETFRRHVTKRPINVLYETRVVDLVQDPDTLEVFGAIVEREGRREAIQARRAVAICTGGFANNLEMQRDYFGLDRVYTAGTPGNTGDGIKILTKAGADLWHMRNRNQSGGFWPAIKVQEYESAFMRRLEFDGAQSFLELGRDNRRFYDESFRYSATHYRIKDHGIWIDTFHFRVLPVHMIFDDSFRTSNLLTVDAPHMTWNLNVERYQWSRDSSVEIGRGWIHQADSVAELARLIGRDPGAVGASIERFNEYAASGTDPEYGRKAEKMAPITNPPFYAVEIVPAIVCTTGGGRRNGRAQVISVNGTPIPRLYEAGELGSTHANLYQNGSFLTEAMAFGRIAGRNAVSESPWE